MADRWKINRASDSPNHPIFAFKDNERLEACTANSIFLYPTGKKLKASQATQIRFTIFINKENSASFPL